MTSSSQSRFELLSVDEIKLDLKNPRIAKWLEMYGKSPKCEECIESLMPGNQVVFDVYMKVQNQHIMSFSGPVDVNFMSVKFIMDMMEIKDQRKVFERVHKIYRLVLSKSYDESKSKGKK